MLVRQFVVAPCIGGNQFTMLWDGFIVGVTLLYSLNPVAADLTCALAVNDVSTSAYTEALNDPNGTTRALMVCKMESNTVVNGAYLNGQYNTEMRVPVKKGDIVYVSGSITSAANAFAHILVEHTV